MAPTVKTGPQDMPPAGGYDPLPWQRVKLRTFFTVPVTVGLFFGTTLIGTIGYYFSARKYKKEQIEMRSARHAILPLLIAERDRAFLKQCRINRDDERELMKNDPEWDVGTYYREPIYITMPDQFHEPSYYEFFAHADYFDAMWRVVRRHFY